LACSVDFSPLKKLFSLSCLSHANVAQSNDKVFPVPVGDSSKAFCEF